MLWDIWRELREHRIKMTWAHDFDLSVLNGIKMIRPNNYVRMVFFYASSSSWIMQSINTIWNTFHLKPQRAQSNRWICVCLVYTLHKCSYSYNHYITSTITTTTTTTKSLRRFENLAQHPKQLTTSTARTYDRLISFDSPYSGQIPGISIIL